VICFSCEKTKMLPLRLEEAQEEAALLRSKKRQSKREKEVILAIHPIV
jgi:hypothetical protein